MQSVIRLQELTKRYPTVTALDRVSLEVPPGVVFALLLRRANQDWQQLNDYVAWGRGYFFAVPAGAE